MKIKQLTEVYHTVWGKGYVVSVQYRKQNNLVMCYFPKKDKHDFITEKELRSGQGNVTLTKQIRPANNPKDSLEEALSSLFSGLG